MQFHFHDQILKINLNFYHTFGHITDRNNNYPAEAFKPQIKYHNKHIKDAK